MPTTKKRRKRKKLKPAYEYYEMEIEDFEIDYHFGINMTRYKLIEGNYSEYLNLNLAGRILQPKLDFASKATIAILPSPNLDDHWKERDRQDTSSTIGMMQVLNDNETLCCTCRVPWQTFRFIMPAAISGKIKFASIYGEKLRWRRGFIFNLGLRTKYDDE